MFLTIKEKGYIQFAAPTHLRLCHHRRSCLDQHGNRNPQRPTHLKTQSEEARERRGAEANNTAREEAKVQPELSNKMR